MNIWLTIAFGFFGGIIRILVGMLKNKAFTKKTFKKGTFLFTLIGSGLIGTFCALLLIQDYRIVLLAGYAGTDLVQGLYKVIKK